MVMPGSAPEDSWRSMGGAAEQMSTASFFVYAAPAGGAALTVPCRTSEEGGPLVYDVRYLLMQLAGPSAVESRLARLRKWVEQEIASRPRWARRSLWETGSLWHGVGEDGGEGDLLEGDVLYQALIEYKIRGFRQKLGPGSSAEVHKAPMHA